MMSSTDQHELFDIYFQLAQPEDCVDCKQRLDGRDLLRAWEYCEYCGESVCESCNTAHACEAMRSRRPGNLLRPRT
jgi:hypothetical protein